MRSCPKSRVGEVEGRFWGWSDVGTRAEFACWAVDLIGGLAGGSRVSARKAGGVTCQRITFKMHSTLEIMQNEIL